MKGIYGIYIEEELVYIGMTMRSFDARWGEHIAYAEDDKMPCSQQNFLYEAIRDAKNNNMEVVFKAIIEVGDKITEQELKSMEFALIATNKPKYNYQGVKVPYPINANLTNFKKEYNVKITKEQYEKDVQRRGFLVDFLDSHDFSDEINKKGHKALLEDIAILNRRIGLYEQEKR